MEETETVAINLGFDSAEEMEAYYDVCRGEFIPGVIMTKKQMDENIIDVDPEYEKLLHLPREERLKKKILMDTEMLFEFMEDNSEESVRKIKALIDVELSELDKCFEIKVHKNL